MAENAAAEKKLHENDVSLKELTEKSAVNKASREAATTRIN